MIQQLTAEEDLKAFIGQEGLVLIDFYATWCPPCKALHPILESIKSIPIAKVNTDDNVELAVDYDISHLPTLVFFKNGQVVEKVVGLVSKEGLELKIKELSA